MIQKSTWLRFPEDITFICRYWMLHCEWTKYWWYWFHTVFL